MNNAVMDICVQIFVRAYFFSSLGCIMYRGKELLSHMVTVFNHLRNCQTVSKVAAPFHSPSSSVRVGFSPSLLTLVTVLFF